MRTDTDSVTLDSGRTALALRVLSKPASCPFVERHLSRRRAAGLFAALKAFPKEISQPDGRKSNGGCAAGGNEPPL